MSDSSCANCGHARSLHPPWCVGPYRPGVCNHGYDLCSCTEFIEPVTVATMADLTIPHLVTINEERYLPEWKLIACLAAVYNGSSGGARAVASFCDDYFDPGGGLLGRVREQAKLR